MPKRKAWQPLGALDEGKWLEGNAERLSRVRQGLGVTAQAERHRDEGDDTWPLPGPEPPTGPTIGDQMERRRWTGVQPRGQPDKPGQELAALRLGRAVPTTFNIQRHAVMVCGRPVVVPSPCLCVVY